MEVVLQHFILCQLWPPWPCLPSSHAVLTAPLECSSYPDQRRFLFLKMRSRSSSSSFASRWLDCTVAKSSGLILQICLIMALSLHCRSVWINGHIFTGVKQDAPHARDTHSKRSCKRGGGISSLNFFQVVS